MIIPFLNEGLCKDRFEIIGLVLDDISEEQLEFLEETKKLALEELNYKKRKRK